MPDLSTLREAIIAGDATAAVAAARKALEESVNPVDLVAQGIAPAMGEAGRLFEEGEYFVPELLMSARATKRSFKSSARFSPKPAHNRKAVSCLEPSKAICTTSGRTW